MNNEFEIFAPSNLKEYLEHFNRMDYSEAFMRYRRETEPVLEGILVQYSPEEAAGRATDYIESTVSGLWKRRGLWERGYFLMLYVMPLLLEENAEEYFALAYALHSRWHCAHPEQSFGMAKYSELAGGFNSTVLGFKIQIGG